MFDLAEVAELADALGSGPSGRKLLGVQLPPSAPVYSKCHSVQLYYSYYGGIMLKRHQVLLEDYLVEYIRYNAEKYDISFSEAIRLALCIQYGNWISENYPQIKYPFAPKKLKLRGINTHWEKRDLLKHHKLISDIYFETRKAIEFALAQKKKEEKNI